MNSLTKLSIQRPITVAMFFVALAVIGVFAALRLPIEQYPQIEIPFVSIGVPYPNATPEEVERDVVRPIEDVLSTMSGIKELRAYARSGNAFFQLTLDYGRNVTGKGVEAKELIEGIRHRLPENLRQIALREMDPNAEPLMNLTLSTSGVDLAEAFVFLDNHVRKPLERIEGVNSVAIFGLSERYVRIALQTDRVAAHRLDYADLLRRINEANFLVSAAELEDEAGRLSVRPVGQFADLVEIGELPVNDRGLKLKDVAEISLAAINDQERRRVNGNTSVGLSIFKRPEANVVEVARAVQAKLAELNRLPSMRDWRFLPLDDQGKTISDSLNAVRNSGLVGAFLSLLVLWAFLRQWTSSFLVAMTIPMSIAATLGVMYFYGMSLNILSLVGLMLAVGLLIDNSVVVLDAIALREAEGMPLAAAAARGTKDVGIAIVAGTFTTIIVFVPSFMTEIPMVAMIQQNIAIPLCAALLASLVIAQTLIPAMRARVLSTPLPPARPWLRKLTQCYERLLVDVLRHRLLSALGAALLVVAGVFAYERVEVEMSPAEDSRQIRLFYLIRGSMEIERVEAVVSRVEAYLEKNRERFGIENLFSSYSTERARTTLNLSANGPSSLWVQDEVLREVPVTPGVRLSFGSGRHGGMRMGRSNNEYRIRLRGESTQTLVDLSQAIMAQIDTLPGVKNVSTDAEDVRQEVQVRLNGERLNQLQLNAEAVARVVAAGIAGTQLRRGINVDAREVDIWVELAARDHVSRDDLENLPIRLPNGDTVALRSIAQFVMQPALRTILREDQQTSVSLTFEPDGVTPESARQSVEGLLSTYQWPPGYGWESGDAFREDEEMFRDMTINIALAFLLIYMVMAALFESLLFPSAILFSIVYSFVGVALLFWLTETSLTAMALTGMLLLMGLVVNNGIVLLERIIALRREGFERQHAVIRSCAERLRPILITVITTVAGMLPLAVGDVRVGGVGPSYYPMARAVIGGLLFSTLVTLVVLPLLYVLMDDAKNRIGTALVAILHALKRAMKAPDKGYAE